MTENIRVLNNMELHGALVLPNDSSDFPENPALGTFVIKDRCLYGFLRIGGMETWYPFASKTQSFIHTQGVASLVWYVTHNLGTANLWIQVKDELGNIVAVGKEDVSINQFKLTFTTAIRGTCVVVAPDSVDVPVIRASLLEVGSAVQIDTTGVKIHGSYALTAANIADQITEAVAPKADKVYVDQRFTDIVGAAPAALDTLKEIADQLSSDQGAVATLTTVVSTKASQTYVDQQLTLKADNASLSTVARSGAYADLTGKPSLGTAAARDVASTGNASATQVVMGSDSRLTDARAPVAHTHAIANITNLQATLDALTARIAQLETNMANAVVYSDGKLHY